MDKFWGPYVRLASVPSMLSSWNKVIIILLLYVGKDSYKLFLVIFQLSYGPWLMSEFGFHLRSWEQIDGFWWHFVYAVLCLTMKFSRNFQQSYGPWLMLKFQFFSISLEIMNGFW